jgi:hypothetical protein
VSTNDRYVACLSVFNFALVIFNLDTVCETVEREAARLGTAIRKVS